MVRWLLHMKYNIKSSTLGPLSQTSINIIFHVSTLISLLAMQITQFLKLFFLNNLFFIRLVWLAITTRNNERRSIKDQIKEENGKAESKNKTLQRWQKDPQ